MNIRDGSNMYILQDVNQGPAAGGPYPHTGPQSISEVDLNEFFRRLWRRKLAIFGTIITVMAIVMVVLTHLTPLYSAVTLVEIGQKETNVFDFEAVVSGLSVDASSVETQIRVIRSRKLANKTVEKLQLYQDPEFNPALRAPSAPARWLDTLLRNTANTDKAPSEERSAENLSEESEWYNFVSPLVDKLAVLLSDTEEPGIEKAIILEREQNRVINKFLEGLKVESEGISRVIAIWFESANPRTAASITNTLADYYIVAQLDAKLEATQLANEWLNNRIKELREEVEVTERATEVYRERSGLIRGSRNVSLAVEQISELSTQHVLAKAMLAEAEARFRHAERLLKSPRGIETASEVLASPLIQKLREEESRVERQVAELSVQYGERHPTMINARAEHRDLTAKIKTEVNKIIEGLRNEVAVARARAASLIVALDELKHQVGNLNTQEVQLRSLEREAAASRSLLETLLARAKETASQVAFQQPDATILSYAAIPQRPSFPPKVIIMAVTLGFAIILGLLLASVIESLDSGFRSMEQVERLMGMTPLGLVPTLKGLAGFNRKPESSILEKPASAFGEAIRSLHTNLLLSDSDKRPKVILIASALPKEGKTTVVVSLARMLSSIGQKVLVIDCDMRRSSVHKAFGLDARPGLVECLNGEVALNDVIREDQYSGTHLLSSGAPADHPPNLLSSDSFRTMLNTLSQGYDLIILDSAPVLAVSDSLVLSRVVDKVVYLVRWVETRRETAINGIKQIVDAGGDMAGVLLTMVDAKEHAQYGFGDSGSYAGPIKKYYTR